MLKLPRRRLEFVAYPFMSKMNRVYELVLSISDGRNTPEERYNRIVEAEHALAEIEKPLWVWWNICAGRNDPDIKRMDVHKRAFICERFNEEMLLLRKEQKNSKIYSADNDNEEGLLVRYYTDSEIMNAIFLTKLSELHQIVHGKVLKLPALIRGSEANILVSLTDDAWWSAINGNKLRLGVPGEREERKKSFCRTVSDLEKAERPMFSVLSIGGYSNDEMQDWIDLFNECLRLIKGIQKSDRRR